MNLSEHIKERLAVILHEDEAGRVWVKDPTVKGGGFWRERKKGKKKVEHPHSQRIAAALAKSEKMMESGEDMDAAFDEYETAYAKVNDKNRLRVRDRLKKMGSQMEVMSNNA